MTISDQIIDNISWDISHIENAIKETGIVIVVATHRLTFIFQLTMKILHLLSQITFYLIINKSNNVK